MRRHILRLMMSLSHMLDHIQRYREALYHTNLGADGCPATEGFRCHLCPCTLSTLPALRRHLTVVHHVAHAECEIDHLKHAVQGLPQCAHCLRTLTTWGKFRAHVET